VGVLPWGERTGKSVACFSNTTNATNELLPRDAWMLLITLEYGPLPPEPPFSVEEDTVRDYFGAGFHINHLRNLEQPGHRVAEKFGLNCLSEHAFAVTRL
jgi:thiopurine S-methyltransferase